MSEPDALDEAIAQYERAMEVRADGDDAGAFELIEAAMRSIEFHPEAGIARARFAISLAELATRTRQVDEAIGLALDAVALARGVASEEPLVEASALYMLGKAQRPSLAHRHGAASFERAFTLWRKHDGDASAATGDAATALGAAYLRVADWQRAANALDFAIEHRPEPSPVVWLHRAIANERLGSVEQAQVDLDRWLDGAGERATDNHVRAHLCASRLAAGRGDASRSAEELSRAHQLAGQLPPDEDRRASLLEGEAWLFAVAAEPPWPLAAEVLMRRAAALVWTPPMADTARRIAMQWRHGVGEPLVQPTFAVIDVEACLETWDALTATYSAREGRQRMQLVVAGAPTTIERLADERWRELCLQRVFSTFHAEQFDARDTSFVAPIASQARRIGPADVLALLPILRIPKWATAKTVTLSSLGEIEITNEGDIARHAVRAMKLADTRALDALVHAVPSLDREEARRVLAGPIEPTISPAISIPLIPGS